MKLQIKWFPNSWVYIITDDIKVCIDPAYLKTYFKKYSNKTEYSSWPNPIDGLPNGLPKADLVLVTHHHKDHCKLVTVKRVIHEETVVYAAQSCKKELGDLALYVKPNQVFKWKECEVKVVQAYNSSQGSSTIKQHKKGVGVGYILKIGKVSIYHAGDTDLIPEMEKLGSIDIAFIPTGGKFTMDAEEAFRTLKLIRPQIVFPIHHLKSNPQKFKEMCSSLEHVRCIVPEIGEEINLEF